MPNLHDQDPAARFSQTLQRMAAGTLGGRSASAMPVTPKPVYRDITPPSGGCCSESFHAQTPGTNVATATTEAVDFDWSNSPTLWHTSGVSGYDSPATEVTLPDGVWSLNVSVALIPDGFGATPPTSGFVELILKADSGALPIASSQLDWDQFSTVSGLGYMPGVWTMVVVPILGTIFDARVDVRNELDVGVTAVGAFFGHQQCNPCDITFGVSST